MFLYIVLGTYGFIVLWIFWTLVMGDYDTDSGNTKKYSWQHFKDVCSVAIYFTVIATAVIFVIGAIIYG